LTADCYALLIPLSKSLLLYKFDEMATLQEVKVVHTFTLPTFQFLGNYTNKKKYGALFCEEHRMKKPI